MASMPKPHKKPSGTNRTIYLPDAAELAVREQADDEGRSVSDVIARLILAAQAKKRSAK